MTSNGRAPQWSYETVYVETEGPLAYLVLNRPEVLNAMTTQMVRDIAQAVDDIETDDDLKVIIVKGAGRAFSSGYDLKCITTPPKSAREASADDPDRPPMDEGELLRHRIDNLHRERDWLDWQCTTLGKLWRCRKPTIAQVHGYCYAGGGSVAGFCDIIVAADNALFGQPESRAVGYPPELCLWPITIGPRRTKQLLYTGDSINGKEAERIDMINVACPEDELEDTTRALATRISLCDSQMLQYSKQMVNEIYDVVGLQSMINVGIHYDLLGHHSRAINQFRQDLVETKSVADGVRARDAAWGGPAKVDTERDWMIVDERFRVGEQVRI